MSWSTPDRSGASVDLANGGASQLGAVTGSVSVGCTVMLTAGVDTTTAPTGGGMACAPVGAPPSR